MASSWRKHVIQLQNVSVEKMCLQFTSRTQIKMVNYYSADSSDRPFDHIDSSSDSDSDSDSEGVEQNFRDDPELNKLIKELHSDFEAVYTSKESQEDKFKEIKPIENENKYGSENENKYETYYKIQEQILEAELQSQYAEEQEDYVYEPVQREVPVPLTSKIY